MVTDQTAPWFTVMELTEASGWYTNQAEET